MDKFRDNKPATSGNVGRQPSPELKFTPEQRDDFGALAAEIAKIRATGESVGSADSLHQSYSKITRAIVDMKSRQIPTDGFEVGMTGLVIGASPDSYLASQAMGRLAEAGHVNVRAIGWFSEIAQTIARLNEEVDAAATSPAENIYNASLDKHTAEARRITEADVEAYIQLNQLDDLAADKLRLLVYSALFSSSKDPYLRGANSPLVQKLVAYMS